MAIVPNTVDPFPDCQPGSVLFGTGLVLVEEPSTGEDVSIGNATVVDLDVGGELLRTFPVGGELQQATAVTREWRLGATTDTFAIANLARLFNTDIVPTAAGFQLNMETVRDRAGRRVILRKQLDEPARCELECDAVQLVLWNVVVELPFTLNFGTDATLYSIVFVALPDAVTHPTQPFGRLELICREVVS